MEIRTIKYSVLLIFSSFVILGLSCQEAPESPVNFESGDFPAPPVNIRISTGDQRLALSWTHPKLETVESFKILRQDTVRGSFRNIGTSSTTSFIDTNLRNNIEYRYVISSVGVNGLEGNRSEVITGIPGIFSVLINGGFQFTNSRAVNLAFGAPGRTTLMKISNDSLFTNAEWINFSQSTSWTLTLMDGLKTVYVKFRDNRDQETIEPVTDTIFLDTNAKIRQLTHDAATRILTPADTVHFVMNTGEPRGVASVDINNVQAGVDLFDDGTNGDRVPDDGIYEVDYIIPTGPEVENTLVVGRFTDVAGNVAQALNASARLTIRRPPTPVELIAVEPVISSSTALNLFWSRNSNADFANYRVYRQTTPNVTTQSPLVTIIQDRDETSFRDTGLSPNTTYYYRVYVFDATGLSFGSNERSGTTNPN